MACSVSPNLLRLEPQGDRDLHPHLSLRLRVPVYPHFLAIEGVAVGAHLPPPIHSLRQTLRDHFHLRYF